MKNIDKNVWIAVGVVVILIIVLFANKQMRDKSIDENKELADEYVDESLEEEVVLPVKKTTQKTPAVKPLSYEQALVMYKDARIQLDTVCQASRNFLTFKNGASVMIDNRSASTRTVKVDKVINIEPWNFKIVNLNFSTLPTTLLLDCDNSQNVATIIVQE